MRISLFITCYNDLLFAETGVAVVSLLERLGHQVTFRPEQTCCGQMHYNTGYQRETIPLVRKFVETFASDEVICSPSVSCEAMIGVLYWKAARMAGDRGLEERGGEIVRRGLEFPEWWGNKLGGEVVG